MKGIAIILGAVLIILGIVAVSISYPTKCDHETKEGRMQRSFDEDAEKEYRTSLFMMWIGIISSIIGALIITLFVLVAHSKRESTMGASSPRQSLKDLLEARKASTSGPKPLSSPGSVPTNVPICHCCRHLVNKSWEKCPNCGAHLDHLVLLCPIGSIHDLRKEG